ncbi:hypothetical protein Avbf_11560 [Armadillidium vulgare]|nr:hypothetical protein Avbf_11560 [Armadillidium vulgare]
MHEDITKLIDDVEKLDAIINLANDVIYKGANIVDLYNNSLYRLIVSCGTGTVALVIKSCIRNEFRTGRNTVITSWLNLLPITEEHLALKKHRLPEAPLRPVFQKEKIRWARHCQDIKRVSLKLPNLVFVDEHSTCLSRNYLLHFIYYEILKLHYTACIPKIIFPVRIYFFGHLLAHIDLTVIISLGCKKFI